MSRRRPQPTRQAPGAPWAGWPERDTGRVTGTTSIRVVGNPGDPEFYGLSMVARGMPAPSAG
ncbi:hypothetical protein GCM10023320_21080 [Pseudonocardia adelaidensis]|uniref:Uncharacterized protein n=1 Tax=Pseudonocardia adelaidensis TaxID=648754 RepID=A0ABP9NFZ7_9PSEU